MVIFSTLPSWGCSEDEMRKCGINALDALQEKNKLLQLQVEKLNYFKFLNYKPACYNEEIFKLLELLTLTRLVLTQAGPMEFILSR